MNHNPMADRLMELAAEAPPLLASLRDQSTPNPEPAAFDLQRCSSELTDVGAGAQFALQCGNDLRFCHERGAWLIWSGDRWQWDARGAAMKRAQNVALSYYSGGAVVARQAASTTDEQEQAKLAERAKAMLSFARTSQRRERLIAMLALAKSHVAVSIKELDTDPCVLNCRNGTVDLKTGTLSRHQREDFCTHLAGADYNPTAAAPNFGCFIARIFKTTPDVISFVQAAMGYSLTGMVNEQCLFFAWGRGANGKTTLLDAVTMAMGTYARKSAPDLLMSKPGIGHPCDLADLMGARLITCAESNDGSRFDESKLKDLTGETVLKARFMRENFFDFRATHKLWLYSNHRPAVRGTDEGIWRRMRLIPFVETIGDAEKDRALPVKLAGELEGILAWLVAGAVRWFKAGLQPPPEVADATRQYRAEQDTIGMFLAECTTDDEVSTYAAELYGAYVTWCEQAGERPLSQKRLGTTLADRAYISEKCTYSNRKKWRGLKLISPNDSEPSEPFPI